MRLKILLSAYACEPGKGSEPGVGWNFARHMAEHHEVWVLTRANNRQAIEEELTRNPVPGLHFIYHDLPAWARFWKRGQKGVQLYYYLWQLTAIPVVRQLHCEIKFDLVQHVTFVKYWAPSALAFLEGVPFIWGPVGGGESAPLAFWPTFGLRGFIYESFRSLARRLGELDPLVQRTARRTSLALATTPETTARLRRMRVRQVKIFSQLGLSKKELTFLNALPHSSQRSTVFLSLGHLLHWKGFYLGIMAFAQSGLSDAEYWIVGDGPERSRLERQAKTLGVADRVRLFGQLPRAEVLNLFSQCHALVHPSLHDSGGWVCMEAMAAGRPVICLDLGGPATQVAKETGFKATARKPTRTVVEVAQAMRLFETNRDLWRQMGNEARQHVQQNYSWRNKAQIINELYRSLCIRQNENNI
ncbi:MAG: glycosyltransferase [Desulfomicrobium sp.]